MQPWKYELSPVTYLIILSTGGTVAVALVLPILQFFCIDDLGMTQSQLGLSISMFHATGTLSNAVMGRLSDAFGRQRIILTCLLWAAGCWVITAHARSSLQYQFSRTLAGFGGPALPALQQAYISDIGTEETRGSILGTYMMTHSFGFASGAALSAVILQFGITHNHVLFVTAVIYILLSYMCLVCLPESLPPVSRKALCHKYRSDSAGVRYRDVINGGLLWVWVARFLASFGSVGMHSTYGSLVKKLFGWEARQFAFMLVVLGAESAMVNGFVFPRFRRRLGKHNTAIFGMTIMTVACTLLAMSVRWKPFRLQTHVTSLLIMSFGIGVTEPAIPDLVSVYVSEPGYFGLAQGATHVCRSFAAIVAPVTFSIAYDRLGADISLLVCGAISFALAALAFSFSKFASVEGYGLQDSSSSVEMQHLQANHTIGNSLEKNSPTE